MRKDDTITATYMDADNGQGGTNVPVSAVAGADCQPPAVSSVAVSNIGAVGATVSFNTNEPTWASVRYGTSCGALTSSAAAGTFSTSHSLRLTGLSPTTPYYFAIDARDEAGNMATDNNGGACYAFTTTAIKADFDAHGDVDMVDCGHLQLCLTHTGVPPSDTNCQNANLEGDASGDVDANDMAIFLGCLSGPNVTADSHCMN